MLRVHKHAEYAEQLRLFCLTHRTQSSFTRYTRPFAPFILLNKHNFLPITSLYTQYGYPGLEGGNALHPLLSDMISIRQRLDIYQRAWL